MGHLLLASSSGAGGALLLVVYVALYIIFALGVYGSYQKAAPQGEPAWAAFIPIYNFIVLLRVAGRPASWAWFLLLVFVPFVGSIGLLVVSIIVLHDVSKSFGHGAGFTVGLVLLSVIFWYILWLGKSQYRGPAGPAGVRTGGGYGNQYPAAAGYPPPQPGYTQQPGYPPAGQAPPPPAAPPAYPPQGAHPARRLRHHPRLRDRCRRSSSDRPSRPGPVLPAAILRPVTGWASRSRSVRVERCRASG